MVVTRAEVYEKVVFAERPVCLYRGKEMKVWASYETGFGCGSRWGTPYLFICANDEHPLFVDGWGHMRKTYSRPCSYRCICCPDSRKTETMVVYSYDKSGIIDDATISADKARGTLEDPAVQELLSHFESRGLEGLLSCLLDRDVYYKVQLRAAELIGELGLLEAIEPLRNYRFRDQRIADSVRNTIKRLHDITGTRERPYCAEIVEDGVATCSHCGRSL